MRLRPLQTLLVLTLAMILVAPSALCLDCCCSSKPAAEQKSAKGEAHACCARPVGSALQTMNAAGGCDCPESSDLVSDLARLTAPAQQTEAKDSRGQVMAPAAGADRIAAELTILGYAATDTVPEWSTRSDSPAAPRAPPSTHA